MCTTRNYFTHKSKYISYGYCLRDLEQQCDRQHELQLGHMTYCGHCMIFNKYNSKCGIIYVLRLMLEAITYRTHQSFSSDAVLYVCSSSTPPFSSPSFSTFANSTPAISSANFQSCKFHPPPFFDGPSFSTPANSSHPTYLTNTFNYLRRTSSRLPFTVGF